MLAMVSNRGASLYTPRGMDSCYLEHRRYRSSDQHSYDGESYYYGDGFYEHRPQETNDESLVFTHTG